MFILFWAIVSEIKKGLDMIHPNFPKYDISQSGEVISLDYNHTGKPKALRHIIKKGYHVVGLTNKDGKRRFRFVHRLVAELFIDNPDGLPQINHKDGNKSNNHVSNLEWCTASHNIQHSYKTGLNKGHKSNIHGNYQGSDVHLAKLTEDIVLKMRKDYADKVKTMREICEELNISRNTFWYAISKTSKNRTWKHVPYPCSVKG